MTLRRTALGCCVALVALFLSGNSEARAQFGSANTSTFGSSTSGQETGQSSAALEQTGEVTSSAAIDRGNGFVGGDSSDTFNLRNSGTSNGGTGMTARGMTGMAGMMGRGGAGGGRGGQTGLNNNNRTTGRTALRIPFRIGFEMPRVPAPALKASVQRRITKLPGLKGSKKVVVLIEKETAVLQGTVVSRSQSDLLAGLMLLEPGVYKVRNELVVTESGAKSQ